MSPSVPTILRALADLAPAAPDRILDITRGGQPLVWLRDPRRCGRTGDADRLAAADLLHRDERILRRAWGMVAGTVEVDGTTRKVRLPLLTEPVRLSRAGRGYRVEPAGDLELTPLVTDPALAARLESVSGLGEPDWLDAAGTGDWLRTVAEAAGMPVREVDTTRRDRAPKWPAEGLVLYLAAALFTFRDARGVAVGDRLRAWAARPGLAATALAVVYGIGPEGATGEPGDDDEAARSLGEPPGGHRGEPVRSPLPLNEAQAEVVRQARRQPLTVVSGPPGNGKSHAVVAAAVDVVDRGGSVLVVTQSSHAADVLGGLLDRYPGPTPVLFGDAERRAEIAAMLGPGTTAPVDKATLTADRNAVHAATAEVERLTGRVTALLELERFADSASRWDPLLPALRLVAPGAFAPGAFAPGAFAPGAFAPGADVEKVERVADARVDRWWRRLWHALALRRLRRDLGADRDAPVDRLRDAVEAARALAARARVAANGGTDIAGLWRELEAAHETLSVVLGTAMRHRARSGQRWDREARRSAGTLVAALRAGRNRRRTLLAGLDGGAMVRALPLWIGTVTDVEDLLPPVSGLFDLVILDEASHTDQVRAAPVLARARRALVVGDPRQLRFVSFIADVDVAAILAQHGLDGRVDVRRVSSFDLAAGAAPVIWLDEHFRGVPHLINFSARRFYADRIAVATRHPGNEAIDAIDVVRVPDGVTERGVNRAEVTAALAAVRELAGRGGTSIGVVTPFRDQADAIESALVEAFPVTEIERIGLRVGTVHSFQGSEADAVVVSLAVADGDSPARLRFLVDPTLFNVMVTRARRQIVLITSLTAPNGLVGEYLAYASVPPGPPSVSLADLPDSEVSAGWPGELATQLSRIGVPVSFRYPVGRWSVDLCAGRGAAAVGLICAVHPDGPAAHIARQRALTSAGWRLLEAYPSRWGGDPIRAALDLAVRLPAWSSPVGAPSPGDPP